MLRFAEELLLLLIDEKRGDLAPVPDASLSCALAGAVLMDLALEGRIDTDTERLLLLDPTPLDDSLVDPVLGEIARSEAPHDTGFWVERIAERADELRAGALSRLTAQGILEAQEDAFLSFRPSVSRARRYPSVDQEAREDVRLRVMRVLFSDDIPDPRDIVIISLAEACGSFARLLSPAEHAEARERIALVSRMDLIGRSVVEAIRQRGPSAHTPARAQAIPVVRPPLNDLLMGRGFLTEQYRKLGPVFEVRKNLLIRSLETVFLTRPLAQRGVKHDGTILFMAGPEANRFFQKNDKAHFSSHEFWMPLYQFIDRKATGATASMGGENHFRMRRIKRPGYSRAAGETRVSGVLDVTRSEIASWPQDTPIAGTLASKRLVYNLMCRIAAGISAPEYFDDARMLFETAFKCILGLYPSRLRLPRLRRARERMQELTHKIVALHQPENRGDRPPDLIDHLLALHDADPEFMPETDLGLSILEPLFAPIDTMGNAIPFMLYELLKNPELLQQARAEADELFAQGAPTAQAVRQLDVIKRAFMETLRLHSIVPLTMRMVTNSFDFAGCTVPAGRQVVLPFTLAHHLPACFPDPERFDVERFAPPRNEHQQPGVYMPFGLGTHHCIGSHLAEFLAVAVVATILHDVDLTLDPPDYVLTERRIKRIPTRHPGKSFRFRVVRRRSTAQ